MFKVGDKVRYTGVGTMFNEYFESNNEATVLFADFNYVNVNNAQMEKIFKNSGGLWVTVSDLELINPSSIWSQSSEDLQATLNEEPKSKRFNQGKIQTREIDPAFILGIGEVLTKSRVKYDHFNWCKPTKLSTPYESLMRHLMAFQSGEDFDPDDGCHHMLKVAVNAMFIHYHNTNFKEESDDRFFKKKKNEN